MASRLHNGARMSRANRALLVASLLVAPALAAAQTVPVGTVVFQNGRDFPMFINGTECASGSVTTAWTPQLIGNYAGGTVPNGGYYVIYGSNQAPRAVSGVQTCWTPNDVTAQNPGLAAGQVFTTQNTGNALGTSVVINTQALVAAAGKGCTDGAVLTICVQGIDAANGNALFSIASASVTISTTIPPPPTITGITPGDSALNVSWDAGTVTSTFAGDSYSYQLEAVMVGTTTAITDPNTHTSSTFTSTSARFDGLVNSVVYAVTVRAFSKAGNASNPSAAVNGTPGAVNDFWDAYKAAGGRDNGGCASGLAGPLAMALVAGALALSRRRR
jgi:hypothetical protein